MDQIEDNGFLKRNQRYLDIVSVFNNELVEEVADSFSEDNMTSKQMMSKIVAVSCGFPVAYYDKLCGGDRLKKKIIMEYSPLNKSLSEESYLLGEKILKPYIKNFDKVLVNGYSLYFYGDNARGKTFTALFIAYYLNKKTLEQNCCLKNTFYYINFQKLIDTYLTSMFDKSEEYLIQFVKAIMSCDLLIIDEIGKEGRTHNQTISAAEHIIKYRISSNKPVILIGNMKPEKEYPTDHNSNILDTYGQSVYSALCEKTRFIYFSSEHNPDMRKKDSAWDF